MILSELPSPSEIIKWSISEYPDIMMATGLNVSGTALIDIAAKSGFSGEVVFVDTGFHFPETLQFWDNLANEYLDITFVKLDSKVDTGQLFETDPVECCRINKISPLDAYLAVNNPSAILNARTRDSASGRSELAVIEYGSPVYVNPLISMTRGDTESYLKAEGLRFHPLYESGFLSMGCWPCTRAVKPGEEPRSGRFVGQSRTECGLWGTIGSTAT